jgi:hypothetical protein
MGRRRGGGLGSLVGSPKPGIASFFRWCYAPRMKTVVCKGCGASFLWPRRKKWCDSCAEKAKREYESVITKWSHLTPEQKLAHSRAKDAKTKERMKADPVFAEKERARAAARNARRYERLKAELAAARAAGLVPMPKRRKVDGLLFECLKCHKMLPRGQFPSHGKNRRRTWCKQCYAPEKAAHAHNRHKRSEGRGTFTANRVRQLLREQQGKCANCYASFEVTGYHVDHIVSLARGGRNDDGNIQLLCPRCNLRKGSK